MEVKNVSPLRGSWSEEGSGRKELLGSSLGGVAKVALGEVVDAGGNASDCPSSASLPPQVVMINRVVSELSLLQGKVPDCVGKLNSVFEKHVLENTKCLKRVSEATLQANLSFEKPLCFLISRMFEPCFGVVNFSEVRGDIKSLSEVVRSIIVSLEECKGCLLPDSKDTTTLDYSLDLYNHISENLKITISSLEDFIKQLESCAEVLNEIVVPVAEAQKSKEGFPQETSEGDATAKKKVRLSTIHGPLVSPKRKDLPRGITGKTSVTAQPVAFTGERDGSLVFSNPNQTKKRYLLKRMPERSSANCCAIRGIDQNFFERSQVCSDIPLCDKSKEQHETFKSLLRVVGKEGDSVWSDSARHMARIRLKSEDMTEEERKLKSKEISEQRKMSEREKCLKRKEKFFLGDQWLLDKRDCLPDMSERSSPGRSLRVGRETYVMSQKEQVHCEALKKFLQIARECRGLERKSLLFLGQVRHHKEHFRNQKERFRLQKRKFLVLEKIFGDKAYASLRKEEMLSAKKNFLLWRIEQTKKLCRVWTYCKQQDTDSFVKEVEEIKSQEKIFSRKCKKYNSKMERFLDESNEMKKLENRALAKERQASINEKKALFELKKASATVEKVCNIAVQSDLLMRKVGYLEPPDQSEVLCRIVLEKHRRDADHFRRQVKQLRIQSKRLLALKRTLDNRACSFRKKEKQSFAREKFLLRKVGRTNTPEKVTHRCKGVVEDSGRARGFAGRKGTFFGRIAKETSDTANRVLGMANRARKLEDVVYMQEAQAFVREVEAFDLWQEASERLKKTRDAGAQGCDAAMSGLLEKGQTDPAVRKTDRLGIHMKAVRALTFS